VTNPKWGVSKSTYFFDKGRREIAKGLGSIKYLSPSLADELFELSKKQQYIYFVDLLRDMSDKTSVDSRQLDILIKIDFFTDFGNQRELLRIVDLFIMFKKGQAKQIKKAEIDGTPFEEIVGRYAVGITKSGGIAKSYTLLDVMAILRDGEAAIKSVHMEDLDDKIKVKNFQEMMGYLGYISGNSSDRKTLYITEVKPLCRKSDGKQFAYSIFTKSIGSGKEGRFTCWKGLFEKEPIKKGDIIRCKAYERDGGYFKLTGYEILR
jgi:DNA polymerase III alpha subunit